ncbi:hypothetical protein SAMN04490244_10475 [Tranquillimonas rosea]|uniref:Tellurium resistance protein n=1 Tax=Tranquillimonas rosea TaxID=641238 RepID=A0A1H9TCZ4_9RHOB|nr:TrgA family protein [Tranquillimonas rosea]SER94483.1 hypothetical protein SAMN04490244_10475 [Tranquillimonas rosea]
MYPTAAKMFAGLLFAGLAWWISDLVKPLLPEQLPVGLLSPVNAALGFVMGWRIVGRRAGDGFVKAAGLGLTALAATVFWALVVWGGREMLRRSLRKAYDGPIEALEDMVTLMTDYALTLTDPSVLIPAVAGAVFCAAVTEYVAPAPGQTR